MIVYAGQQGIYSSTLLNSSKVLNGFGSQKFRDVPSVEPSATWVWSKQIHGTNILHIDSVNGKEMVIDGYDGISTYLPHVILTIKTGDCIPLVYYDELTGLIAASHQGWKGVIANMPSKMIQHFRKHGSKVENIKIVMGPSMGHCCSRYEAEADLFTQEYPQYADSILVKYPDGRHVDLRGLTYLQLCAEGMLRKNFDSKVWCTKCQSDVFFSYRAGNYVAGDRSKVCWNYIMKV